MNKLLTRPLAYYDTAILYPDRNQLRSTEPFLGFAIVGLPLRTILRLSDVDVFEALRWLVVFGSLTYGYLFYRSIGIGAAISAAGAVLCLSMPDLLNGIERLQIVCYPSHPGRGLSRRDGLEINTIAPRATALACSCLPRSIRCAARSMRP